MSGWRIPGFDELHELGTGAQGRVVLARRQATGEMVAIKYLAPELMTDPRHMAMFRDEVNMLARVANPHVARMYEYVETPQGAAIVMEAVNGVSLRDVLSQNPPLPPEAALTALKGSLLGLATAHAARVVHRDYKPANVVVEGNGNSKLIDFGIAVLAGEGADSGTPAYMAPEQWHGHAATPASDVYAATCVFFECVTGRPPYASGETTTLRRMHESAPVPAEAVPDALRTLVAHGMAKDPARRPPGAQEFAELLERVATQTYGPDWERRGWIALGAATAVLAAAFPAAALGMTGSSVLGHGAVHLAGKVGAKGLLGKATGVKVGAGVAAAAVVATTVYLVWPTSQHVGGTSTGSLHMYLTKPGKIAPYRDPTAADSPVFDFSFTVSPSRIRPGLAARVIVHTVIETPHGPDKRATSPRCYDRQRARATRSFDYFVAPGNQNEKANYFSFYPAVGEQRRLPTTRPINLDAGAEPTGKTYDHYDANRCVDIEHIDETWTFTIPRDDRLRPGKYMLSPIGPPRLTVVQAGPTEKKRVSINPEAAGAQAQGRLPEVTILG